MKQDEIKIVADVPLDLKVIELQVQDGQMLNACKELKNLSGLSLKDCKAVIDTIQHVWDLNDTTGENVEFTFEVKIKRYVKRVDTYRIIK